MKYFLCHGGSGDAEEFDSFEVFAKRIEELAREQERAYESDLLEEDIGMWGDYEFTVTVGEYM